MKRNRYTAEQVAFALRQAEGRDTGTGGLSQDGDSRADVLPVEEEVCGDGSG